MILSQIEFLGVGLHWCGWFAGWITVEATEGGFDVMWCSGKGTHNTLSGPALSVEFIRSGGTKNVFTSAITMHLVRGKENKGKVVSRLSRKIEKAARRKGFRLQ